MKKYTRNSLVLLLCFNTLLCFSQNKYNFFRLNVESGLEHKTIYALHEDKDGYLWIGAGTKLQRFDGHNFVNFENDPNNPNSITIGDIRAILDDGKGGLWIGTDGGGLSHLQNGKFQNFRAADSNSVNHDRIEDIIQMPDGSIWIASWGGGINIYKNGEFSYLTHDPQDSNSLSNNNVVNLFYDDQTQILWIGTWNGGLNYMKDGVIHRVPIAPESFNSLNPRVINKTRDGSIWIGSWGEGLFRFKNGQYTNYRAEFEAIGNNNILTLDAEGDRLWIGTWGGGMSQYKDSTFTLFQHNPKNTNSISSDFIESSLIDKNGNLWIGSYGGGITKFESNQFTNNISQNLMSAEVDLRISGSIINDNKGRVWISAANGLKVLEDGKAISLNSINSSLNKLKVINTLYLDKDDNIWIGGGNSSGLYVYNGNELKDFSEQVSFDFNDYFITSITQSDDGKIWVGGNLGLGLVQIDGTQIKTFKNDPADSNSIISNQAHKLLSTSDGSLWIGTSEHGVSVYNNGVFKNFRKTTGQANNLSNNHIHDIIETRSGEIWIGTENGLNRYDKQTETFLSYFIESGLLDNSIRSIVEDETGYLWLGTSSGISRMNTKTGTFDNFSDKDGVKESPFLGSVVNINNDNDIYMGGVNGVSIFSPSQIIADKTEPFTLITNVLKDGNSLTFNTEMDYVQDSVYHIPFYNGSLTFHYSDMQFGTASKTYYSYKLGKGESNWAEPTIENSTSFNSLAPGSYEFLVKTSYDKILWSKPAVVRFEIVPKWHQTTFFKATMVMLAILLAYAIAVFRINILKKQSKKLALIIDNNTHELRRKNKQISDNATLLKRLNKELKTALNELRFYQRQQEVFEQNEKAITGRELHDNISTALFGIRQKVHAFLGKSTNDNSEAKIKKEVDQMIKTMIDDSQIILNNLTSDSLHHASFYDSLRMLISNLSPLTDANIKLEWKGDYQIKNLNIGSNLFRIIKESLSNVIKHAKAENTLVFVKNFENQISLLIVDDGIGFNLTSQSKSRGIQEIRERAKEIKVPINIESTIDYGTKIELVILL